MKNLTCCLLLLLTLAVPMSRANAADNAVVLLYHHVSESTPPSTSVTPAVFEQHMAYLSEGFRVISLEQAVEALRNKKSLPERAVVITFDDGFSNIYHNAHPILRRYKMPYTVFVNPPLIGTSQAQLTWEQMREMESSGARFANHTSHHQHLLQRLEGETEKGWLTRTEQDILQAEQLLQEKLGYSLRYVAYPYGEFNGAIQRWIAENGFVGFGQHSGALYSGSDFTALPRFPAAGIYANLKTLKIKINSLALPVMYPSAAAISPLYPVLSHRTALSEYSFAYRGDDVVSTQMRCYFAGASLPVVATADAATVSLRHPLPVGRSRVNCTAPSKAQRGRYYWYSQPWFIAREDGSFPE